MTQVQITLSAPGKHRRAWRLPDDRMVGLLLPTIVERMGLPTEINWRLVRVRGRQALEDDATLAGVGVRPGEAMALEPIRNTLLRQFLLEIYGEAEGHVQDQLWEKALEKLQELHQYDPRYPDPKGLLKLAQAGLAPSAIPVAGAPWALVVGGLAVAGTLVVGAAAVGGAGYLIWQAVQDDGGGGGYVVQPQTGDVQVTLEWYDPVDLDLHVYDPYGDEVYHGRRQVPSGGELDIDANHPCSTATSSPLENVYWPWGGAPGGEYAVHVRYFSECSAGGTVSYRVTVRVDGSAEGTYSGSISPDDMVLVTRFDY